MISTVKVVVIRRGEPYRYFSGWASPIRVGKEFSVGDLIVFGWYCRGTYTVIEVNGDWILLDRPLDCTIRADREEIVDDIARIGYAKTPLVVFAGELVN